MSGFSSLTAADLASIRDVAGRLGVPQEWLIALINFETAGTFNPKIKNPNSSGRGLIQFLDATARGLGYNNSLDLVERFPGFSEQLRGPVFDYLKRGAPFRDKQDFYFHVFLPKYRRSTKDTVIYADAPEAMATFRIANPGVETVGDYFSKLERNFAKLPRVSPAAGTLVAVALLGLIIVRLLRG